jgi:hypothetical protein
MSFTGGRVAYYWLKIWLKSLKYLLCPKWRKVYTLFQIQISSTHEKHCTSQRVISNHRTRGFCKLCGKGTYSDICWSQTEVLRSIRTPPTEASLGFVIVVKGYTFRRGSGKLSSLPKAYRSWIGAVTVQNLVSNESETILQNELLWNMHSVLISRK